MVIMPTKHPYLSIFSYRIAFIINILLILNTATHAQTVAIPDSNLEAAIRDALGIPTAELTSADLASLTSLVATDSKITDLTGLEAAVNLTFLDLSRNQISDLSALSGLTSLAGLFLDLNRISDIRALSELTSLTQLFLNFNRINDISALNGLTSLTQLFLNFNRISDISALSGLTSMEILYFFNNQISDISALSELTSLERLYLYNNRISDISTLSRLTRLTRLDLGFNLIGDISALNGLTSLIGLNLSNNQIINIGALAGLINLRGNSFNLNLGPQGLRITGNFIDTTSGSSSRQIIDALNAIDGLTVEFEPQNQNLDIFLGQPIIRFPRWRTSPWYFNYNIDFWPWIYHDEHGWQYVAAASASDVIFLWDLGLGQWIFFNENSYRWIFIFGGENAGWVFTFSDNRPGRRFFQRLDNASLFSVPPDLPVD